MPEPHWSGRVVPSALSQPGVVAGNPLIDLAAALPADGSDYHRDCTGATMVAIHATSSTANGQQNVYLDNIAQGVPFYFRVRNQSQSAVKIQLQNFIPVVNEDPTCGYSGWPPFGYMEGQICQGISLGASGLIGSVSASGRAGWYGVSSPMLAIGAAYTVTAADIGAAFKSNLTGAATVTLPTTSQVGGSVTFYQLSTGTISFVGAGGVTVVSKSGAFVTTGTNARVIATVVNNNKWLLSGDV